MLSTSTLVSINRCGTDQYLGRSEGLGRFYDHRGVASDANIICPMAPATQICPRHVAQWRNNAAHVDTWIDALPKEGDKPRSRDAINDVQDVLIVARKTGLTAAESWSRMHQFDSVLERQIAANMMPAGTLIIPNVPLPPDVYRELRSRAIASNQATAQLMTAILTRAARK
jgi:hypothetical protein